MTRVGVLVLPTDPLPEAIELARRLDGLGYHQCWTYDHLSWRRFRDRPWHATHPWLTALACSTERIRFGTMVSNLNLRHPLLLAKDAMTIDHVSAGRLTIGLGAGGLGFDATVLGAERLTPGQRLDRLSEYTPLLAGLLDGSIEHHAGDWFRVDGARLLPGCVQRPRLPIAVAAGGPRGLRLAAAHADAWITYGDTIGDDRTVAGTERIVRGQVDELERACEAIGRDPATIDRIYLIGNTAARPLASIEAFTDFAGRYGDLGFTDLVFHHPRADDEIWNDPVEIVDEIASRFCRAD